MQNRGKSIPYKGLFPFFHSLAVTPRVKFSPEENNSNAIPASTENKKRDDAFADAVYLSLSVVMSR
jgi:hypothetical protein